jgi:hypothetical protein
MPRPFALTPPGLAWPACFAIVCAVVAAGCANRGMTDDSGRPSNGGATGTGSGGTSSGGASGGGAGGASDGGTPEAATEAGQDLPAESGPAEAGPGDASDGPGDVATDAPREAAADGPRDAGVDVNPCGSAPARFNFDSGALQGAVNNRSCGTCPKAFTAIASNGTKPLCGTGALEITAAFSGTSGTSTVGEVDLPLAAAGEDLTGKTITVNVAAVPAGTDLAFALVLGTSLGLAQVPALAINPVTDTYATRSYTFTAGGGISGITSVSQLSLQLTSTAGYTGKIYIDEIDIR